MLKPGISFILRPGLSIALLISGTAAIEAQTDSLNLTLDASHVVAYKNQGRINGDLSKGLEWNSSQLSSMPLILGSSDPLRLSEFIPGISTNSELDGGIHIAGSETGHNDISIDEVPVYGVNHLLGIFSAFNTPHFKSVSFASHANIDVQRIGGAFRASLQDIIPEKVKGELNIGLLSGQGTIQAPIGSKAVLVLSARRSYVNFLYSRFLSFGSKRLDYSFCDYNLSLAWNINSNDKIGVNVYFGNDNAHLDDNESHWNSNTKWGNALAELRHTHTFTERCTLDNRVYFSGYANNLNIGLDFIDVNALSSIMTVGHKADLHWHGIHFFSSAAWNLITPQYVTAGGNYNIKQKAERLESLDCLAGVDYTFHIADNLSLYSAIKGTLFISHDKTTYLSACPQVSISYDFHHKGILTASYGWQQQNVFKTGISDFGLPIEFYLPAGRLSKPLKAQNISLKYAIKLIHDLLTLSAEAYYAHLYNISEYSGTVYGILTLNSNFKDVISTGNGNNYGINLMLSKNSGNLTGWIGYSFSRALRGGIPSNHERLHELNAAATYTMGKWNFSSTFVLASGLPYTPSDYMYILSHKLFSHYLEQNSDRMKPYLRLDCSVSYDIIRTGSKRFGAALSVYNLTGYDNELGYSISYSNDYIEYSPTSLNLKFLPSLNLYYRF